MEEWLAVSSSLAADKPRPLLQNSLLLLPQIYEWLNLTNFIHFFWEKLGEILKMEHVK